MQCLVDQMVAVEQDEIAAGASCRGAAKSLDDGMTPARETWEIVHLRAILATLRL